MSYRDPLAASTSTEHFMYAKGSQREITELDSAKKSQNKNSSSVRRNSLTGKENKEKNVRKFSSAQKKSKVLTEKNEEAFPPPKPKVLEFF